MIGIAPTRTRSSAYSPTPETQKRQAAGANEGCDRGEPDRLDGRHAQAGEKRRQTERQFDRKEQVPRTKSHTDGGVLHVLATSARPV